MTSALIPLAPLLAVALLAQAPPSVDVSAEPHHHLALSNAYVRVFKVEVAPHAATLMHSHKHDYIFIALGPAEISNQVEGKPAVTVKLQDGESRFTVGNFSHIAVNLADTPFRNVTVEFLQDAAAHTSPPPKWDEERGLDILEHGTRDILYVKDGVRVSQIELQPGGVNPSHHHAGPHLIVALTDLDLRSSAVTSDARGKQPASETHLKAGDVKWFDGAYTHTVTNIGQRDAKLIAVEFPELVVRPGHRRNVPMGTYRHDRSVSTKVS